MQTLPGIDRSNPAVNYERFFVPAISAPLARGLVDLAGLRAGERVLDVACGTGIVARLAAEQVGDGTVAGVDPNPAMLGVARGVDGGDAIEWHEAAAEALPLDDGSFDVALCQLGLQFVRDRIGALREMHRVVAPGGRVALNVPGPTPGAFAVLEAALQRHAGPEAGAFVATVFSLHGEQEVRGLLEAAGWTDVQVRSGRRTSHGPPPEEFLWQYVLSTPLAAAIAQLDDDGRAALQREVVEGWQPYTEDGGLSLDVDITVATGRRA